MGEVLRKVTELRNLFEMLLQRILNILLITYSRIWRKWSMSNTLTLMWSRYRSQTLKLFEILLQRIQNIHK